MKPTVAGGCCASMCLQRCASICLHVNGGTLPCRQMEAPARKWCLLFVLIGQGDEPPLWIRALVPVNGSTPPREGRRASEHCLSAASSAALRFKIQHCFSQNFAGANPPDKGQSTLAALDTKATSCGGEVCPSPLASFPSPVEARFHSWSSWGMTTLRSRPAPPRAG